MRSGAVKRVVFLVGLAILFLGALVLSDPVAIEEHNCGTALAPKPFVLPQNERWCATQLRKRRLLGAAIVGVGAVAVILPGPRCLLVDD